MTGRPFFFLMNRGDLFMDMIIGIFGAPEKAHEFREVV